MDYMQIPIVAKCCNASDNIREYFLEERYLAEVDQNDSITPDLLSVMALNLMLDELADIGIESEFSAEDLMQSLEDQEVLFYLRDKFDKDHYYRFLRALTPEKYSEFCGIVENCTIAEDLFIELADFAVAAIPTDIVWEAINDATDRWYSTEAFGRHIAALQAKVDLHTDPNTTPVTDDNVVSIGQFLMMFKERLNHVKICSDWIIRHRECDGQKMNIILKFYDREKLRPDMLAQFAAYESQKPEVEPAFMIKHHETNDHHLEYWLKKKEQYIANKQTGPFGPCKEQGAFCVIALIMDGFRGEDLLKEVKKFESLCDKDVFLFMIKLCEPNWDAILTGEEK